MKTEMYVVSSYEISPSCKVEGGFIRVGEKPKNQPKKVYTMDEAIAKLRKVLREMKTQDREIYRQLMSLNANITRLKKEIKGEEEKKIQNDMELEYDYDSFDTDDDSGSDFEVSDIETDDMQCKEEDSTQSSGIESGELKDPDSNSIHERFDSGIQEDASYNLSSDNSLSSGSSRPRRPGTSWNHERSAMYNFLMSKLPKQVNSQGSVDNDDEENVAESMMAETKRTGAKSEMVDESKDKLVPSVWDDGEYKMTPKVWDGDESKRDRLEFEASKRSEQKTCDGEDESHDNEGQLQPKDLDKKIEGKKEKHCNNQEIKKGDKLVKEESVEEEDACTLHRSQTLQPRTVARVQAKRIVMHRRTQSEDQMKLDLNANYSSEADIVKMPMSARDSCAKKNLGFISEDQDQGTWNAFDARNYRRSERCIRREIMPIKSIRINQQMQKLENHDKKLSDSLTQLNLEGAISNQAIKAIHRSSSSLSCAGFTDGSMTNNELSRSWTMPRKILNEAPPKGRASQRLQKTASAHFPSVEEDLKYTSGFEVGYLKHPNGIVSSTISLV